MVSYGSNCTCNKMTSLAVVSSALLSRHVHWAAAAFIVLGLVAYLVLIGCTSKYVLIPSFITLTPNPLITSVMSYKALYIMKKPSCVGCHIPLSLFGIGKGELGLGITFQKLHYKY